MGAGQQPPPPPPPPGSWDGRDWKEWGRDLKRDIHQRAESDWRRPRHPQGVLFGMIIVAVGLVLLLDNLGVPGFQHLWRFWPVILIVVGASRLLQCRSTGGLIWGLVVAGIGTVFLLDNLGFSINLGIFWPVILIGFGLSMLLRSGERSRAGRGTWLPGPMPGTETTSRPDFHLWALFGGGRRRIDTKEFRGGDVLAIFGGYEIDLRDAAMVEDKAVIDANAMFGGVEIWIPQNWTVEVVGHGIFGGYDDKTLPPRINPGDKPQHLVLTGYAMFGGVTVKN